MEYLQAFFYEQKILYWRDKSGHELDFVLARRRDEVDVVECKCNPTEFDPASLKVFRGYYPHGKNYVVSPVQNGGYSKRYGGIEVKICNPAGLAGP